MDTCFQCAKVPRLAARPTGPRAAGRRAGGREPGRCDHAARQDAVLWVGDSGQHSALPCCITTPARPLQHSAARRSTAENGTAERSGVDPPTHTRTRTRQPTPTRPPTRRLLVLLGHHIVELPVGHGVHPAGGALQHQRRGGRLRAGRRTAGARARAARGQPRVREGRGGEPQRSELPFRRQGARPEPSSRCSRAQQSTAAAQRSTAPLTGSGCAAAARMMVLHT